MFIDKPVDMIARALEAGATGSLEDIRDYEVSWGTHRQGGFTDPFGHVWLVGDKSPLTRSRRNAVGEFLNRVSICRFSFVVRLRARFST